MFVFYKFMNLRALRYKIVQIGWYLEESISAPLLVSPKGGMHCIVLPSVNNNNGER